LSVQLGITLKEGQYLKLIYRMQQEESTRLSTTEIASFSSVQPPTVTEMLQKLTKKGLLRHRPYRGIRLTAEGVIQARKLLRRHRLLETLFVKFLRYSTHDACKEASKLDHYVSDDLVAAICQTYHHPTACPCKKAIFSDIKCEEKSS
jgi:DtxR family Mn-dependent transcriptional regulator